MQIPSLFDEANPTGFKRRFRHELARSIHLDVAVTRLRLSTIDLSEAELAPIRQVRLLLAELRAVALDAEAHALMARQDARAQMRAFQRLLDEGRVRIRVAPLAGWSPDFSIFSDAGGPRALLVGFHAFEVPHPYPGPALGAHFGAPEARMADRRFDEIWARGHDVGPAVGSIFRRAGRLARGSGPRPTGRRTVDTFPALG